MTMTPPLALVTGAAQRLGREFALALASMGFAIGLHYHTSQAQAEQTAEALRQKGVPVYLLRADLSQPIEMDRLMERVQSLPEPMTVLVNSAAVFAAGQVQELPLSLWDTTLDVNLRAPFLLSQAAARIMPAGSLIVNVSDVGAHKTWTRFPAYVVSKTALESLTRLLARALAPSIRVNAIAPGLVFPSDVVSLDEWNRLVERLPLRRPARPDEITSALEFLIRNQYITGQTIVVDGGYSLL